MNQPNSENTPTATTTSNVPEFSVSDLALSLKRTIEEGFSHVRVRGELSRVSIASSGHMYSSLKDDNAVIDAVCWKGVMSRLSIRPEEGLEVICTGRISTYPQRSNYQLIIESMELAGEGALLKMLEERKKKLAAEGLFAAERKQKLPFLPQTIGIVTSPTGAVIRDILHRLRDRMPSHVILWPALVQGEGAATQIAAGIEGLQTLSRHGLPQPDLIIVARGGGSLEDLMPFNEEIVVRAVANCKIPLISAVGHETDTTLIDYAADQRAPTPTAAAEMAVPVRNEIMARLLENEQRLLGAMTRHLNNLQNVISLQAKSLGRPETLLDIKTQTLDRATDRLSHTAQSMLARLNQRALQISSRLRHPRELLNDKASKLERWGDQITAAPNKILDKSQIRLNHAAQMLEAYSFQNVLKRGYTVILDENGKPLTRAEHVKNGQSVSIEFYEQKTRTATITDKSTQ